MAVKHIKRKLSADNIQGQSSEEARIDELKHVYIAKDGCLVTNIEGEECTDNDRLAALNHRKER